MIINSVINIIIITALLIGSYTDFKKREVPDWLNYSLIFIGLGMRGIYSLATFDFSYILYGIFGLVVFLIFALFMFYAGQWGGGDSKMLMGLGALIGLRLSFDSFLIGFFMNILIVGAVYGLAWSIIVSLMNFNKFIKEFKKFYNKKQFIISKKILLAVSAALIIAVIFIDDIVFKIILSSAVILVILTFYLIVFVKAVENACMLKYVKPTELTEGDWIAKDVKVNRKYITGPKDLGIGKKQIKKLIEFYKKGKVRQILIKTGIPFVPSFLAAYIVTLFFGNLVLLFV